MLGWITGQTEEEKPTADNSRIMEPPQTPAPVFAIRAFRSALFGTPSAEDENAGQLLSAKARMESEVPANDPILLEPDQHKMSEKQVSDSANQLGLSPTKSILVTPGTTSNRRKTVSFGGTVLHDDLKRDQMLSNSQNSVTRPTGSVSGQWTAGQPDGKLKPRSRLTQSLLDARVKPLEELPRSIEPTRVEQSSDKNQDHNTPSTEIAGKNDDTVNLEDPQSQSGQYWKAEFESYRKRTNLEIRKLIQYRSVARSYARKKDAEAMRLAEKLRREEEKVADMERRVTGLASNMMSNNVAGDREKLIQNLTRQTALAVQYKHKVDTLRKTLQRHGVVGSRDEPIELDDSPKEDKGEIYRLQSALEEANQRLLEINDDGEMEKLRNLAKSSEARVSNLEKENALLKQGIARFKGELGKYEERRLEKEGKLKQRVEKSEKRTHEYREKLKEYRDAFELERERYREQIEVLKKRVSDMEYSSSSRQDRLNDASHGPFQLHDGVKVHDFGGQRAQMVLRNTEDMLQMNGA